MIEVTFRIESLDYTDKLDSQLPLVLEALSQSGNINPVLKLACNTPEASSRIVKGILRTMSQDQKQRLATKIVNANREKLMRKLNEYAAGKGIDVHICDCAATFRTTIQDMKTMMEQGVSTLVLTTEKGSTSLILSLLCEGQTDTQRVVLRQLGGSAFLTVGLRCRRDLIVGR